MDEPSASSPRSRRTGDAGSGGEDGGGLMAWIAALFGGDKSTPDAGDAASAGEDAGGADGGGSDGGGDGGGGGD